jgi:hypothetical protein
MSRQSVAGSAIAIGGTLLYSLVKQVCSATTATITIETTEVLQVLSL